eukprot:CAMPEP_0204282544 /NCGR_PEP_ID=MMETSP0468-20130131/43810_1 /ASSEMBLY_ACC=CAM_ASM_000383 /TAXON_ID=2969 /ORGANISM="Oxyrrhis marina" /LENGTH=230 /DNA_ID=CAMNT_0051260057 /DNA_START=57 /DNA_END=749 /DNA_ORIENTATION=+
MTSSPKTPTWFVWALAVLMMLSFVIPTTVLFDGSMAMVEEPKEVSGAVVPPFSFDPMTTPAEGVALDVTSTEAVDATAVEDAPAVEAGSTACRIGGAVVGAFCGGFCYGRGAEPAGAAVAYRLEDGNAGIHHYTRLSAARPEGAGARAGRRHKVRRSPAVASVLRTAAVGPSPVVVTLLVANDNPQAFTAESLGHSRPETRVEHPFSSEGAVGCEGVGSALVPSLAIVYR